MKAKSKDVAVERGDEIEQLRTSPIREIPPISNNPIEILIDKIEIDPTNCRTTPLTEDHLFAIAMSFLHMNVAAGAAQ